MPNYLKYVKGVTKSTIGIFSQAAQWLSLNFEDQIIQLKAGPNASETDNKEGDVAIYFIHGTADQACSFSGIANDIKHPIKEPEKRPLLNEQFVSMHLIAFDDRYKGVGIDDFATQLRDRINKNGHRRIILVGHSRGAIVAAYFNEYYSKSERIEVLHCFSICGPFRGSYLAISPLTYFSDSIKQMAKSSKLLADLREKINTKPNSQYSFIIAEHDCVVANRTGYILEYVDKNPSSLYRITEHGHVSILTSTRLRDFLTITMNKSASLASDLDLYQLNTTSSN